ncbi:hypothetical protein [Streptomyces sp. TP-A0356]|uniref:hypothetical protein n=1 Tax=Streptomyces sp. TP-A0356 TaxID=1359208 RepID=UPI0006E3719A|nr:hypothetical protein [Streptomyces sp. TP-A0356]
MFSAATTRSASWWAPSAILSGHATRVAAEMTAQAEREHLSASRREAVDACDRYRTVPPLVAWSP